MQTTNPRRRVLFGFAAGAAVLAMAGSAFACTMVVGMVTIAGPGGVTATTKGTGEDDLRPSKGYCETPSRVEFKTPDTATMAFSLTVEQVSNCATRINDEPSPDGVHQVRWIKATDTAIHNANTNCMATAPSTSNPWQLLGVMNVAPNPSGPDGSGTYSLPATMRGPGDICVAPADPQTAPPKIFMKWTLV